MLREYNTKHEIELEQMLSNDNTCKEKEKCLEENPFNYTECTERFAALCTPAAVRKMLIDAKKKKELKRTKKQNHVKQTAEVTNEDIESPGSDYLAQKALEEDLLELSDKAMDAAEGQGETIVFNPEEITDPFMELLKDAEDTLNGGNNRPMRKNT